MTSLTTRLRKGLALVAKTERGCTSWRLTSPRQWFASNATVMKNNTHCWHRAWHQHHIPTALAYYAADKIQDNIPYVFHFLISQINHWERVECLIPRVDAYLKATPTRQIGRHPAYTNIGESELPLQNGWQALETGAVGALMVSHQRLHNLQVATSGSTGKQVNPFIRMWLDLIHF